MQIDITRHIYRDKSEESRVLFGKAGRPFALRPWESLAAPLHTITRTSRSPYRREYWLVNRVRFIATSGKIGPTRVSSCRRDVRRTTRRLASAGKLALVNQTTVSRIVNTMGLRDESW